MAPPAPPAVRDRDSGDVLDLITDDEADEPTPAATAEPKRRGAAGPQTPAADVKFKALVEVDDEDADGCNVVDAAFGSASAAHSAPAVAGGPAGPRGTAGCGTTVDLTSDSDDGDDEMLLAPIVASALLTPATGPRPRRNSLATAAPTAPAAGLAAACTAPARIPTDEELLAGAAAVDKDENNFADVGGTGDITLSDLVPDLNAGTSGFQMNDPLFASDPGRNDQAVQMSTEKLMELVTSNNVSADATAELPTPPELSVELMKHQKRALHWMVRRELCEKPAHHPNGGILADDQGFGKTLSAISLMLANKPAVDAETGRRPPWGTLIVCPLSLVSQWELELCDRIEPAYRPSVLIYHGPNRPKDPHQLVRYDVVITTYAVMTSEYPKVVHNDPPATGTRRRKKGPLFKIKFFRVVLDEAQAIKNRRSEGFAAAFELRADRRWALTGTPIQNSVDDMYSLFTFLRYIIVSSYQEWKYAWKAKMEAKSVNVRNNVFKRFQAVLGVVLLRRAKHDTIDGRPVIDLPPRNIQVVELQFSADEREFYSTVEKNVMAQLKAFSLDGGATPDFMFILLLLLRLRQACSHPSLCHWSNNAGFVFTDEQLDAVREARAFKALPAAVKERMMTELAPGADVQHTCPICMDVLGGEDGVVTECGHIFCVSDFEAWAGQNDTCPSCRQLLPNVSDVAGLARVRMEVHALMRARERKEARLATALAPVALKKNGLDLSRFGKRSHPESGSAGAGAPEAKRAKAEVDVGTNVACGSAAGALDDANVKPDVASAGEDAAQGGRERRFVETAKIKAFIQRVEQMIAEGDEKCLAFSQWTRMLELVSIPLRQRGILLERLDGTMDACQRSAAIANFKKRSDVRVFLISLKAGGCGLNLTEASRVHMLDMWWNPSVEDQAIDRVHRIGQRKTVTVYRYKVTDTVEDRIMELQGKKRMLAEGALGVEGMQTMGRRRLGLQELMSLFRDVETHVRDAETPQQAGQAAGRDLLGRAVGLF